MSIIEVENLSHDYEGKGDYAVKDVSFAIEEGEIFGFLGPSGAGKSTVQNLLISKGMKQRLVFARALINRPQMLFLDEPTAGLDPNLAGNIKDIIRRKRDEGATIFLTTHNMYIADELCDRVAFINEGQIVAMDAPRALKLHYGERSVRVEYRENGDLRHELFFLEDDTDRARFSAVVGEKEVQTVHSQEATLEQTFMKITGRGLT